MVVTLKNAHVWKDGKFVIEDFMLPDFDPNSFGGSVSVLNLQNAYVLPGLVDVHVHLREPGFFYKETIASGSRAAAHGGYSDVCAMPNLNPVPDSVEHLEPELEAIRNTAVMRVHAYGALTVGEKGQELADIAGMAPNVIAYSDDGHGVQSEEMMKAAMAQVKAQGKVLAAHCEDNSLLHGGYIHDGEYCRLHGHKGICAESEWGPVKRDCKLAEEVGVAYHVCHVSSKDTVQVIREAKARGVNVTCETGPHYLLKNDMMLKEEGRFKMNPPIRSEEDRLALIQGILDGTVDMIATDHAPHSAEEKSRGLEKSLMGVVGLETAFPVLYTGLVKTGVLSLEKLIDIMSVVPRKRFGIPANPSVCVWDLDTPYEIDPEKFLTMGRATPFAGETVYGRCVAHFLDGKLIWAE